MNQQWRQKHPDAATIIAFLCIATIFGIFLSQWLVLMLENWGVLP